jgi:galactonate dehydratase
MAEAAAAAGFDAVKLAPFDGMPRGGEAAIEEHVQRGIECIAAVRRAIGADRDLLVDVHNTLSLERALKLDEALEPLKLFWLEEVTPKVEDLAAFRRGAKAKTKTAGGEGIFGLKEFQRYMAAGAVETVMPDPKYCGGLLEMKRIGALGEAFGLTVSPHGPASPVGNAAAAQVCATMPNFLILEHAFGEVPWRAELIEPPEALEKGRMKLSGRPGFGITLNERVARKYAV